MRKINLCFMVKDCTSNYVLEQFCIHYSKLKLEKVFYLIHSENKTERIDELTAIIESYFLNTKRTLSLYDLYNVEEEGIYFTNTLNFEIPQNEWLLIVDIDEFIEFDKISESYFEYDVVKGLLIDRVGDVFNPEKSIFENFPNNYFLYGTLKTSFPKKISFIKKQSFFIRVGSGHHEIHLDKNDAKKIKVPEKVLPVFHFKWREDTKKFLLNAQQRNKDNRGGKIYNNEINELIQQLDDRRFEDLISECRVNNTDIVNEHQLIYKI